MRGFMARKSAGGQNPGGDLLKSSPGACDRPLGKLLDSFTIKEIHHPPISCRLFILTQCIRKTEESGENKESL